MVSKVNMKIIHILLLVGCSSPLIAQVAPTSTGSSNVPIPNDKIREVLVLARDATLEQQQKEGGGDSFLSEKIQALMTDFRAIDNWQNAIALRARVIKEYKIDVDYIAPPHSTPTDYEVLTKSTLQLDQYKRAEALQYIVTQELAAGYLDAAQQTAASIPEAWMQSQSYAEIGTLFWKHGNKDLASKMFQTAADKARKIQSPLAVMDVPEQLNRVAEQRYKAGDSTGTMEMLTQLKTMAEIADGYIRDRSLERLARTECDLGLLEQARDLVGRIEDEIYRKSVERCIAYQEVVEAEPTEAVIKALAVPDREQQLEMLTDIASKQREQGKTTETLATLDQAFRISRELLPDPINPSLIAYRFRLMASTYMDLGAKAKAEAVLRRLNDLKNATPTPRDQYDFLVDLSVGYAALGDFDLSHQYVSEMGDNLDEQACDMIGYEQTSQGQAEQAIKWARGLADPAARASALVGIAKAMLDANEELAKKRSSN